MAGEFPAQRASNADNFPFDDVIMDPIFQVACGNSILLGSTPLAHRYGGHQFSIWAGQLGDGRAHLLGEYVNARGERWHLQLKGSGKTPYSRRGDGRAVVRSSVREFLASEALYHLGRLWFNRLCSRQSDKKVWKGTDVSSILDRPGRRWDNVT